MAVLSTTLALMRQGFLQSIGEFYSGTTTADGNAGGTTFIDTTKRTEQDNFLAYQYALMTSGTYSGQIRQVASTTQSTSTITAQSAYGGKIVSSVTYEICRYHPTDDTLWAINRALLEIWPDLGRQIINEDLVTGNWLPNGSFEDWDVSTTPNKWAAVGAGATAAEDTTNKLYGSSGLSLTRAGTDCYVHCSDTQWPWLLDLGGEGIRFEAWIKASVASRARLNVFVNGSSVVASDYHTGGGNWEFIRTDQTTITDSPTSISFRCEVNTGNTTAYFDYARVIGPQMTTYLVPLAFSSARPQRVLVQRYGREKGNERPCDDQGETFPFWPWPNSEIRYDDTLGLWLLRFKQAPPIGYKVRLEGTEYFSTVSAETDTVALEPAQLHAIYALAAQRLFEREAQKTTGNTRAEFLEKAAQAERDFRRLNQAHSYKQLKADANFGSWKW